jgi:diguanylate cyclase (GGDEF)-like protein
MVGLLLAAFASVLVIVDRASQGIATEEVGRALRTGERVFEELLDRNRHQLELAAKVLASDFGFREAVASNDLRTVRSVLQNHGARIRADTMMLASLERQLLADTQRPAGHVRPFPFPGLIDEAEKNDRASAIVAMRDGRLYQLVVVPVQAPVTIAWVAMGFLVDDSVVNDLRRLTGLEVSFLRSSNQGQWQLVASSLSATRRAELVAALPQNLSDSMQVQPLSLAGEDYATSVRLLPTDSDYRVLSVLQQSIGEVLEPFSRQQTTLRWVAAIASLLAMIAGVMMARTLARPINRLAQIAMRIKEGDYSEALTVDPRGEIGALAQSIHLMREGIETREREILRLAYEDALTGLPNRGKFHDCLENAVKLSKRTNSSFSILMMDLDRFKYVNDTLGHHVGDVVLLEVGRRLRALLRESDTVARLGGDEFAVLLQNVDVGSVDNLVQKVQRALEQPIVHEGTTVDVGTSIGIANFPEHGEDPSLLLRRADMAMYAAKRNGVGHAVFDASYDEFRQEHLSLLSELRRAIQENQLQLHYQPQVSIERRCITAVEALLRWDHPTRGLIPPSEFIPFAEQTGFIKELTLWVIRRALHDGETWAADGVSVRISVNVSARDLGVELSEILGKWLPSLHVPASKLCLEITESALMENPEHAQQMLAQLHKLGLWLSIDDYGTGHASLAYLKNFPVQEVKIDRMFVKNMAKSHIDAAIVRSTIGLAHELGLLVVAEGVEEMHDLELLTQMGCDFAQGYYISRPLPAADFARWWKVSEWGRRAGTFSLATSDGLNVFPRPGGIPAASLQRDGYQTSSARIAMADQIRELD